MKRQSEHIVFEGNDIAGLYTIDGFEVRRVFGIKRFWEGVDEIIRLYRELHPNEIDATIISNQVKKDLSQSDTGAMTGGAQRLALSIPLGLLNVLKEYEPTIIKDEKLRREFMKRYPALRGCNVI